MLENFPQPVDLPLIKWWPLLISKLALFLMLIVWITPQ